MDKYGQRNKGKLEKKNLRLFQGDAEFLDEMFPRAGYSIVIRMIVHNFVKKLQANINKVEIANDLRELNLALDRGESGEPHSPVQQGPDGADQG